MSASLGADGTQGGPQLTSPPTDPIARFSWTTMPENLSAAGISWKLYRNKTLGPVLNQYFNYTYDDIVMFFKQAQDPRSELARFGMAPTYPFEFMADVKANRLPQVSWVVPNTPQSEHLAVPPYPSRPSLSHPGLAALPKLPRCIPNVWLDTVGVNPNPYTGSPQGIPYRVPFPQSLPSQETPPPAGSPAGLADRPATPGRTKRLGYSAGARSRPSTVRPSTIGSMG